MRRHRLGIAMLALLAVSAAVAGCGGGGKSAGGTRPASAAGAAPAGRESRPTAKECAALGAAVTDLQVAAVTDSGFDYLRDRNFLDGYADRAPSAIASDMSRMRDVLDKIASAMQSVGVAPNKDPLPDQADALRSKLQASSDEQAANARSLAAVDTWQTNEC